MPYVCVPPRRTVYGPGTSEHSDCHMQEECECEQNAGIREEARQLDINAKWVPSRTSSNFGVRRSPLSVVPAELHYM